jgi:glycerate 2-kinase
MRSTGGHTVAEGRPLAGHVLVAPDKFKGSLSGRQAAEHLAAGLRRVVPGLDVDVCPVADGGDGTLDAVLSAGFRRVPVVAAGPTGDPVHTAYAERDGTAVVELADVSGLSRLPGATLAPMTASSYGVGEVIGAALDAGCATLVLGIGGSASTDGGAGMVQALGARLLDATGADLPRGGAALAAIDRLDVAGFRPCLSGLWDADAIDITVASDVDDPLLGPRGAAAVYGPQKGADAAAVRTLEAALARWAAVVGRDVGVSADLVERPGAGAAGGVGFAAMALLGARMRAGIELALDLLEFSARLDGARLVITGEGALDEQTLHGKAVAGVAAAARAGGVPVVAVAGRATLSRAELDRVGIRAVYSLADLEPDPRRCMTAAGPLLEQVAARLAADWLAPERAGERPR